MKKIIAIGGGEIGRPGYPIETTGIDREIIRLTGKRHPKLLFIPTASSDSEDYTEAIKKHFGKRLGCEVDTLLLIKEKPILKKISDKILGADIVYVGGGNTLKMLNLWKKLGVDRILQKTYAKTDTVLSGLSAGAICWFKYGNSDSKLKSTGNLARIRGLNYIDALACPHYNAERIRRPALKSMMKITEGVGLAFDNCCAIEVIGDKYRILSSKKNANAYKVYWKNGKFYHETIEKSKELRPLAEILTKR